MIAPLVRALSLAVSIPVLISGTAAAATALIDFGNPDALSPYNQVSMPATGSVGPIALVGTTTAPTGWTATVVETGTGGGGNVGAGAYVSSFPAGLSSYDTLALRDGIFANQGAGTDPRMVLTFGGLNASLTYDLLLYGSRANAQGLDQRWSLTQGTYGAGGADVNHFSELNATVYVDWMGVKPNGSGVIEVTIFSPGPDNLGALALNFGSISEVVPEPSSALLFGLAGLALLVRRRR